MAAVEERFEAELAVAQLHQSADDEVTLTGPPGHLQRPLAIEKAKAPPTSNRLGKQAWRQAD